MTVSISNNYKLTIGVFLLRRNAFINSFGPILWAGNIADIELSYYHRFKIIKIGYSSNSF